MSEKTKEELKAMAKQLAELNEGFAQLAEGDEEKEMSFGQAANQFAQGLLFNTSDEIKAGFRSVFGDKTYDEAVAEERADLKQTQTDFPYQSAGYQVGGAITSGILTAPLTLGASIPATTARLAFQGGKTLKSMAGAGLIQGTLSAEGAREGELTDEYGNILTTAAVSAIANPVVGGALKLGGNIIKGIANAASKRVTGSGSAVEDELLRIVEQGDLSIEQVIAKIKAGEIIPEMSDGTRNAVLGFAGKGGKGAQIVSDELKERKTNFINDTYNKLQNSLSPESKGGNIYQTFLNNKDKLFKEESNAYTKIFNETAGKTHDEIGNAVLGVAKGDNIKIINRYLVGKGEAPLIKIVKGKPQLTRKLDVETGENVKRALMDKKDKSITAQGKKLSTFGFFENSENTVKNAIDNVSPALAATRKKWAQISSSAKLYQKGETAMSLPSDKFSVMAKQFFDENGKVIPDKKLDLDAFRSGIASFFKKQSEANFTTRTSQINKLSSIIAGEGSEAKNLAQRQNLETIFPKENLEDIINQIEKTANTIKTQARIDLGSKTQRAAGETSKVGSGGGGAIETAKLFTRAITNPLLDVDAWRGLANKLAPERAGDFSDADLVKIGNILISDNPELVEKALTSKAAREQILKIVDTLFDTAQIGVQRATTETTQTKLKDVNPRVPDSISKLISSISPSGKEKIIATQ